MRMSLRFFVYIFMALLLFACSENESGNGESGDGGSANGKSTKPENIISKIQQVYETYCDYIDHCRSIDSNTKAGCLAVIENQENWAEKMEPCGSQMIAQYTCVTDKKCSEWEEETQKFTRCRREYPNDDDQREKCEEELEKEERLCGKEMKAYQECLKTLKD